MLTYWLPAPVAFWVPLTFAIAFAIVAVLAVAITVARRGAEPDAGLIAMLYGVGFGVIAVSELMMYLDIAFGWSLATTFAMTTSVVTFFAIAAAVIAVVAIVAAVVLQSQEERGYQMGHPA